VTQADKGLNLFNKTISAIVYKMSCTRFLKQLACIRTETAAVDSAVNKQLNAAQQIAGPQGFDQETGKKGVGKGQTGATHAN